MSHIDQTISDLKAQVHRLQETIDCLHMLKGQTPEPVPMPPAMASFAPEEKPVDSKPPEKAERPARGNKSTEVDRIKAAVAVIAEPFTVYDLAARSGAKVKAVQNCLYRLSHRGDVKDAGMDGDSMRKLYVRRGTVVKPPKAKRVAAPPPGSPQETLAEIHRSMAEKGSGDE